MTIGLILEDRAKVSMKLLSFENFNVCVGHNIWDSGSELLSAKRAGASKPK